MTQSQKNNWMDWPDIISFRDTFIANINNDIRDKLILALYTYIPPRRIFDYFAMYILDEMRLILLITMIWKTRNSSSINIKHQILMVDKKYRYQMNYVVF